MDTMTVKAMHGDIALAGTDRDLVVMFHKGIKPNAFKSREVGAPVYDPVDYVKVIHPGEPLNTYDQPVRDIDKLRFAQHWAAYEKGKSQETSGTPLSVLFPANPEIIKTLEAIYITTVQQLANLPDTAAQNLMFGFNLRDKAKDYLAVAERGVGFHQLQAAMEELRAELREKTEKLALANTVQPMVQPVAAPSPVDIAAMVAEALKAQLPTKRSMSEENKAAARERMRAYHASRKAAKTEQPPSPAT